MKLRVFSIVVFVILTFLTCDNNLNKQLLGCWQNKEGYQISFLRNGILKMDDSTFWKYKILNDSLLETYDTPFDNFEGNKSTKILFLDDEQLILYDSLWSKKEIFNKCPASANQKK